MLQSHAHKGGPRNLNDRQVMNSLRELLLPNDEGELWALGMILAGLWQTVAIFPVERLLSL